MKPSTRSVVRALNQIKAIARLVARLSLGVERRIKPASLGMADTLLQQLSTRGLRMVSTVGDRRLARNWDRPVGLTKKTRAGVRPVSENIQDGDSAQGSGAISSGPESIKAHRLHLRCRALVMRLSVARDFAVRMPAAKPLCRSASNMALCLS